MGWQEGKGVFRMQPLLDDQPLGRYLHLVHSEPSFYIDTRGGPAGEVRTAVPSAALSLAAPPVPAEKMEAVDDGLAWLLPPSPAHLQSMPLKPVDPLPLLSIQRDETLGTLARLRMDYGGRELSQVPEKDTTKWVEGKKNFEMPRNLPLETG